VRSGHRSSGSLWPGLLPALGGLGLFGFASFELGRDLATARATPVGLITWVVFAGLAAFWLTAGGLRRSALTKSDAEVAALLLLLGVGAAGALLGILLT